MRSTSATFGFVAAAVFLLAGCAVIKPETPTVVTALSQDQLATLRLKGLVSTAPDMDQAVLEHLTEAVRTEIAFESPGIFVEAPKALDSHALTMRLQFTEFTIHKVRESAMHAARAYLSGSNYLSVSGSRGESIAFTISADVLLVDDNNIVRGKYWVQKAGSLPCDDSKHGACWLGFAVTGFAKTVAKIVKH